MNVTYECDCEEPHGPNRLYAEPGHTKHYCMQCGSQFHQVEEALFPPEGTTCKTHGPWDGPLVDDPANGDPLPPGAGVGETLEEVLARSYDATVHIADVDNENRVTEVAVDDSDSDDNAVDDEDYGTGPYEDRNKAQLAALASSRGLTATGTKDEIIERLRG